MLEEEQAAASYKTYQFVGLLLGPIVFLAMWLSAAPAGLSQTGWATAALAVWMAIWWANREERITGLGDA